MSRLRRLAAALIVVAIASSVAPTPATAYVHDGWVFQQGIGNLKYYQGAANSNTLDAYNWARTTWNNSASEFWMPTKVSTASSAQFRLWEEWSSSTNDGESWRSAVVGGYITYVDIYLNTRHTDGYTAAKRNSVSAHEFGHAASLGDIYGASYHILMNGATPNRCGSPCVNAPVQDDLNGVNDTY